MAENPERDVPVTDAGEPDRERRWSLAAALVLSFATLCTTWCSFQASAWGSTYSTESRAGTKARIEAVKFSDQANRQISSDLQIFTMWFEAEFAGDAALAREITARFRPHFVPAFDAWLTEPVGADGHLPDGTPFDRPEYVLPIQAEIDDAYDRAETATLLADEATAASGRYILNSVLYASVLFLAGIASKLPSRRVSHGVVVLAAVVLVAAVGLMVALPVKV